MAPGWKAISEIISDAAVELGLVKTDIADPFAATDPNVLQLLRLLKSAGKALAKHRDWHNLQKEYTFVTTAGVEAYALPADYRKLVGDSEWNRTTQFPLGGPLSGQQWQALKARNITSTITVLYRIWQGQIFLRNTSSAQTIALEYQSLFWLQPVGQATPTSEAPTTATDVVCFDPAMMIARLKRDFRRAKKQDSQAEEEDYIRALTAAENEDAQGRTIYLGDAGPRLFRRIDALNLPETIG